MKNIQFNKIQCSKAMLRGIAFKTNTFGHVIDGFVKF